MALIQQDVIKGSWCESLHCYIYYEFFYIIAKKGNIAYIHYFTYYDNWNKANKVLRRIKSTKNFSPENKPKHWKRIYDLKPIRPQPRRNLWWIKYA